MVMTKEETIEIEKLKHWQRKEEAALKHQHICREIDIMGKMGIKSFKRGD